MKKIQVPLFLALVLFVAAAFRTTSERVVSSETTIQVPVDTTKQGIDPATGFVIADGFELVRANCTGCHSSKLVTQYRATREVWLEKIHWMQRTQNLWDLGESEPKILDYLAKHYAPNDQYERRRPLKDIEWHTLEKSTAGSKKQ